MIEPVYLLLLALAPGLPLMQVLLLTVPAARKHAMAWSAVSAIPALALALFVQPGLSAGGDTSMLLTTIGLDELSRIFLAFTAALWLLAAWFAHGYLSDDRHPLRFHIFFQLSMSGNFLLLLAQDIPTFFSGFALMGFASCGLVVHRNDEESLRAGRIYLMLAALGEVMLFVALGQLATRAGSNEIAAVVDGEMPFWIMLLLLGGFGIKAGFFTLHFWLPLAHPAAPVPASAVLSGAMIKAGLFGWLRFLPLGMLAAPSLGMGLIVTGLTAAGLGALFGITQRNAKTVLAYSSVSQMGIMTVGLGAGFLEPAAWSGILPAIAWYAVHHGLAKGALFLGVTPAREAVTPWKIHLARFGLLVPALALAGAPFTSGIVAKLALKSELSYLPAPWDTRVGALLAIAAIGTTLLMARFLVLTWPQRKPKITPPPAYHQVWLPWSLAVVAVMGGFLLLPDSLAKLAYTSTPEKMWLALWPILTGAGLALAAFAYTAWRKKPSPAGVPAGDIVVVLEWLLPSYPRRRKARPEKNENKTRSFAPWRSMLSKWEQQTGSFSFGILLLALLLLVLVLIPSA